MASPIRGHCRALRVRATGAEFRFCFGAFADNVRSVKLTSNTSAEKNRLHMMYRKFLVCLSCDRLGEAVSLSSSSERLNLNLVPKG